jgi:hypothetical protein
MTSVEEWIRRDKDEKNPEEWRVFFGHRRATDSQGAL